jgi:alkaline phosphatase
VRAARLAAWLALAFLCDCLAGCAVGNVPADHADAPPRTVIVLVGAGLDAQGLGLLRKAAGEEGRALAIDGLPASAAVKAGSGAMLSALMRGAMSTTAACGAGNEGKPGLLERARAQGLSAGIISTVRITGRIAASAYAFGCDDAAENDIAAMLVPGGAGYNAALGGNGLDLVLGGGRLFFVPPARGGNRVDGRNLLDELSARGFSLIDNIAGFRALDATVPRVFGLFAWDHISDEADRDAAAEPGLAQMSAKAMELLSRNRRGYFLLVESGQIGELMRQGDPARATVEAAALDDALKAVMARAQGADPGLAHTLILLIGEGFTAAIGKGTDAIATARDGAEIHRAIIEATGL